jgi:hypothetical protein
MRFTRLAVESNGKAMEDWLQAEREIDAAIETSRTDH